MGNAVAAAPLEKFMGVFGAAHLTGYVPLYTKNVAKVQQCATLFGIELCEDMDTVTWCGVLGGNCQTEFAMMGMKLWVPGLCSYTKTICRMDKSGGDKAEAEMKALVTAENLNVKTMALPCMNHTGFPPSMTCPLPSAPGINGTLHQTDVAGFVDGPHPAQKDLDDAESMIVLLTSLVIALGALGSLCSCGLTALCVRRFKAAEAKFAPTPPTPASSNSQPTVLTSQPVAKEQPVEMSV